MECTNLQELRQKWNMEETGSECCGVAKGLAIHEGKSLIIDGKTLQIVIYSPKLKVTDKRT